MSQPPNNRTSAASARALQLEYPMRVAVFEQYADAQRAVDYLADQRFAVENLAIVGTDLRQYERVMGRRTWQTVLTQGAMSGLSTGLLVALMVYFLRMSPDFLSALLVGVVMGLVIGLVFAAIGHLLTKGPRDFESITQTYANSYEVLAEHKVVQQARDLLAGMPGGPVGTGGYLPEAPVAPPVTTSTAEVPTAPVEQSVDGVPTELPSEQTFDPRRPQG